MRKPGSKRAPNFAATVVLAAAAVALFLAGEALILTRTDAGRISAARYLHLGDAALVTEIVGRHVRRALEESGVPRDSIQESLQSFGGPRLRWRAGLRPRASALQTNYAITRELGALGAQVTTGREAPGPVGGQVVTLVVGLPGRATHEIVLVSPGATRGSNAAQATGRLSIVLFGLGDDARRVKDVLSRPQPFAVALPAGQPWSAAAFRAARDSQREIVLHLPLEPLNYPQMNPGPGAILVTMGRSRIEGLVRKYLGESGPVVAVANLMGSLATQDQAVMAAVFHVLREQRTPFLHMSPAAGAVCRSLSSRLGVAYQEPDAVLDAEARRDARALDARWRGVLDRARTRGQAIVMVRATDQALAWLPGALSPKRLGSIEIVPLTSLVRRPIGV